MLKFANPQARYLADQLMQPALIRVVDNIRKCLETSEWRGDYQETQLWPEGIEASQMQRVKALQARLATATPEEADTLRAQLMALPQPFPGYELHLTRDHQVRVVDVWELCYCVCFEVFPAPQGTVTVDASLVDTDVNDVDWLALDEKAKSLVNDVFKQLGA